MPVVPLELRLSRVLYFQARLKVCPRETLQSPVAGSMLFPPAWLGWIGKTSVRSHRENELAGAGRSSWSRGPWRLMVSSVCPKALCRCDSQSPLPLADWFQSPPLLFLPFSSTPATVFSLPSPGLPFPLTVYLNTSQHNKSSQQKALCPGYAVCTTCTVHPASPNHAHPR